MTLTYEAGRHTISMVRGARESPTPSRIRKWDRAPYQWTVTVDALPLLGIFTSGPDAWTPGVREADRLDFPGRPDTGGGGDSPRSIEAPRRTVHPMGRVAP
jgi:hypothetical protein